MATKEKKPRLALHFQVREDKTYNTSLILECSVMYERPEETQRWVWCGSEFQAYSSLTLHSYIFADTKLEAWPNYDVQYRDVYSIKLHDAERHYKTLKHISTAWEKMKAREGAPRTLGQSANQFARVIGCEYIVETRTEQAYDNSKFQCFDLGSGVSRIDYIVRQWLEKQNPVTKGGN